MTTGFQQQQTQYGPTSRSHPRPKHGVSFARPSEPKEQPPAAAQEPRSYK